MYVAVTLRADTATAAAAAAAAGRGEGDEGWEELSL